jgi:hypothetical protein
MASKSKTQALGRKHTQMREGDDPQEYRKMTAIKRKRPIQQFAGAEWSEPDRHDFGF